MYVDTAACSGMKFASFLMLTTKVLMSYHQQLPQDENQVSPNEAGQLLLLLGLLVRLTYDQLARFVTRSVKARQENISAIPWQSVEAKVRMLALWPLGDDLIASCFQQLPAGNLAKFEFQTMERHRPRPLRTRDNRAARGGRSVVPRTSGKGAQRGRGQS